MEIRNWYFLVKVPKRGRGHPDTGAWLLIFFCPSKLLLCQDGRGSSRAIIRAIPPFMNHLDKS